MHSMDQGTLKSLLRYDPATGVFVWLKPPYNHPRMLGKEAGSPRRDRKPYHHISIGRTKHKRSRLAWLYMTGDWPANQVDHKDGNSLNDCWSNLRLATPTQNAWNHKTRAKASALPMGVRSNPSGSYSARLAVNKRMLQLGTFDTPQEAAAAYQSAREVHYGEFA